MNLNGYPYDRTCPPLTQAAVVAEDIARDKLPKVVADPLDSARLAQLRYVTDDRPGIRRKKRGARFRIHRMPWANRSATRWL